MVANKVKNVKVKKCDSKFAAVGSARIYLESTNIYDTNAYYGRPGTNFKIKVVLAL